MRYLLALVVLLSLSSVAFAGELNFNYGVNSLDINNDGKLDLVIKSRVEIGNAHSFDKFDFFVLEDGVFYTISNDKFTTVEGADCTLQNYKFIREGKFKLVEYKREMGSSYNSQESVYKTEYILEYDEDFIPGTNPYSFKQISKKKLSKKYCDVNSI